MRGGVRLGRGGVVGETGVRADNGDEGGGVRVEDGAGLRARDDVVGRADQRGGDVIGGGQEGAEGFDLHDEWRAGSGRGRLMR